MGNINIIVGRSGSGKTRRMLEKIKNDTSTHSHVIITTDMHTHEVEREMCQLCGDQISLRGEVLSFSRLCNHVFFHCGGLEDKELDGAGRMLLLYRAVKETSEHLSVLNQYSKHTAFFEKLMKTVDELKTNEIPTELLFQVEASGGQKEKIKDIATICAFYDCFTKALSVDQRKKLAEALGLEGETLPSGSVLFDPRDRLTRMGDKLRTSNWGAGKVFWVDGFADFTPQQQKILRYLAVQGEEMTVNLMGENRVRTEFTTESVEAYLFAPTLRSREILENIAKEEKLSVTVEEMGETHSFRTESLSHLEKHLFSTNPEGYTQEVGEEITVVSASTQRSEVEWVASEILNLVQYENHRFRDIVVVARDFSQYRHLITSIFKRYDIPVFTTEMTNILEKPVISVVCAVFHAIAFRYSYDAMFSYLRTGFSPLSAKNIDRLEEYVLLWDIKGEQWKKPFTYHPKSFDQEFSENDKKTLEYLNKSRLTVMEPLMKLEQSCDFVAVKKHCEALYTFLEEIKLYGRIQVRQTELEESGDLLQKAEYEQLWDILVKCLEQCHDLTGEQPMELAEFSKLFTLLLSQCKVGTIPVALDQVTAGETTRLKNRRGKTVFWLGAEEKTVPMPSQSGGLFNDLDRIVLESLDISLDQREEELYYRETTTAYEICSLPSARFYISYPSVVGNGEGTKPCFIVENILTLFPTCQRIEEAALEGTFKIMAKAPALDYLHKYPFVGELLKTESIWLPKIEIIQSSATWNRGELTPLAREILYGTQVTMSATRLKQFNACYFAHFMKYGLRARPRKQATFNALEFGKFIHWVLQELLEVRKFEVNRLSDVEKALQLEKVKPLIDAYLTKNTSGALEKSARAAHLFHRLRGDVEVIAKEALDQLEASSFSYLAGELPFLLSEEVLCKKQRENGLMVSFQGSVDRVDGCILEDAQYFHPVDYKSGKQKMDLSDIYYGRDLQLPLYYLALEQEASALLEELHTDPSQKKLPLEGAAMSYFFAKELYVSGSPSMTDDQLHSKRREELKRIGLYRNHEDIITALEEIQGDKFKYLPLKKESGGNYTGKGLLLGSEWEAVLDCVRNQLWSVSQRLETGCIAANPYDVSGGTSCDYCDFKRMCFFEKGKRGETFREEQSLSTMDVLDKMREQTVKEKNSFNEAAEGTPQPENTNKKVRFPRPSERRKKQEG